MSDFKLAGRIEKLDEDQQLVFGWASVVVDKRGAPVVDSHNDVIEATSLEKVVYGYVLDSRKGGERHEKDSDGSARGIGRLVESVFFTVEKSEAMGIPKGHMPQAGWWVGFKVDDPEVWELVKSGVYTDFSIGGRGTKEPLNA